MKTKRINYRNNKKTFRKKNKYNKKGGVWWFGDITGRKNVNANRYRELKNTEEECAGLKDQIVSLQTRINQLENELRSKRGLDFANSVSSRANEETMRTLNRQMYGHN